MSGDHYILRVENPLIGFETSPWVSGVIHDEMVCSRDPVALSPDIAKQATLMLWGKGQPYTLYKAVHFPTKK